MKWRGWKFFYDAAQKGARAQRVTMPMFNAFWQQNKLIEMRSIWYCEWREERTVRSLC